MNKFKEFLASINWSEVKPHTVVSLILQVLAWINMGLTADEIDQIMEKVADKDVIVKVDKDLFEKELDDVAEGKESDDIVG